MLAEHLFQTVIVAAAEESVLISSASNGIRQQNPIPGVDRRFNGGSGLDPAHYSVAGADSSYKVVKVVEGTTLMNSDGKNLFERNHMR